MTSSIFKLLIGAAALALAACGDPGGEAPDPAVGGEPAADNTDTAAAQAANGEPRTLTVYSARHYDSDEQLYALFEEETGIELETIEAGGDLLIERVRADGERSPADIIITVDAGRLWRAEEEGLFAPFHSDLVNQRVPEKLRHPDGLWFGFSKRARVIVYAPDRVDPETLDGYQSLADPRFDDRVCVRSSGNVYNISLMAALIERWGVEQAEEWAQNVTANFARIPSGGDIEQIRAVAAGECDLALVNHYYFARFLKSGAPADQEVAEAVSLYWPEGEEGVHVNISGAGMAANAPHPEEAGEFLEFMVSDEAQRLFPELTNEYPAVPSVTYDNEVLDQFGEFQADDMNVSVLGENQAEAQRVFDRAGWP